MLALLLTLLPPAPPQQSASPEPPLFAEHHRLLPAVGFQAQPRFADLDGDGDLDAVLPGTPSFGSGNLLLLWNRGGVLEPSFVPLISYLEPYFAVFPETLDVGDLDGDGDTDVLVSVGAEVEDSLQLLLNDGRGELERVPAGLFYEDRIQAVRLGDADGDGDLDVFHVAYVSGVGNVLRLALQVGDLFFVDASQRIPAGLPSVDEPVLADLDGDLDLDVVLVAAAEGPRLLFNDGQGDFAEDPSLLPPFTGSALSRVTAADLEPDGDVDLVLVANPLGILRNVGAGRFEDASELLPDGLPYAAVAVAVDVDGDEDLDLVLGARPPALLHNEGAAGFVDASQALPAEDPLLSPSDARCVDLDGDGAQDLLWLAYPDPEVWLGDDAGGFVASRMRDVPQSGLALLEDLDGDGDLDALSSAGLLVNDGNGVFELRADALPDAAFAPFLTRTGDVDGDGDADLVGPGILWRNDGSGGFSDDSGSMPLPEASALDLALGDLDGDGDSDAFLGRVTYGGAPSYEGSGPLPFADAVWSNDGAGVFSAADGVPPVEETTFAVALGDLDGDGDLDAYAATGAADVLYENAGDATFTDATANLPAATQEPSRGVSLGDLDGDGDLDAYVGGGRDRVLRNDGAGAFEDVTGSGSYHGGGNTSVVRLVDVDEDGDLDALGSSAPFRLGCCVFLRYDQRLSINDGAAGFADAPYPYDDGTVLATGDLDGDGDVDVLAGSRVYRNQTRALQWRVLPRLDRPLDLELRGRPLRFWGLAASLETREQNLPHLGTFWLDPGAIVFRAHGRLDEDGRAGVRLRVPADPALAGETIYWQALIGAPLRVSNLERTTF